MRSGRTRRHTPRWTTLTAASRPGPARSAPTSPCCANSMPGLSPAERWSARTKHAKRSRRKYILGTRLSAERFSGVARAHWGVENGLHRILGVTMNKDGTRHRKDNDPETIALLRRPVLNRSRLDGPRGRCKGNSSVPAVTGLPHQISATVWNMPYANTRGVSLFASTMPSRAADPSRRHPSFRCYSYLTIFRWWKPPPQSGRLRALEYQGCRGRLTRNSARVASA